MEGKYSMDWKEIGRCVFPFEVLSFGMVTQLSASRDPSLPGLSLNCKRLFAICSFFMVNIHCRYLF